MTEDLGDEVVAAAGGVVERRPALGVGGVDVGLAEQQELRHIGAVVAARQVQRSHAVRALLRVQICSAQSHRHRHVVIAPPVRAHHITTQYDELVSRPGA